MLGSLFVTLREGFEAALVIGIVLAYLRRSGAADRSRHVWAGVATWMIFWMGRQARTLGAALRTRVSQALVVGGHALFWVAFVATAREGIETALFMYASTGNASP